MFIESTTDSTYDLAWITKLPQEALARLKLTGNSEFYCESEASHNLKHLLNTLVLVQHPDGSWGSKVYSYSDRLLNTLAALSALSCNQKRWPQITRSAFPSSYQNSLKHGLDWLNTKAERQPQEFKNDPADLAGFELLVPALLAELTRFGLSLPPQLNDPAMISKAKAKLGLISAKFIYQAGSPLSHALEFTGELLTPSVPQVVQAISANGSVGNSPAATAFVLSYAWPALAEERRSLMLSYLNKAATRTSQTQAVTGWPVTYPVTQFVSIWHEYYQHLILPTTNRGSVFTKSAVAQTAAKNNKGFGADDNFSVDCDTTATYLVLMAEYLLAQGEFSQVSELLKTMKSFFNFEKGYFTTYPAEMTASVTTNAHAWQALYIISKAVESDPDSSTWLPFYETTLLLMLEQSGNFIYSKVADQDIYWRDKWHISPIYATLQVVAAGLLDNEPNRLAKMFSDLLKKQARDGGWSLISAKSNFDETFHCLLLLKLLSRKLDLSFEPLLDKATNKALTYLNREGEIPAMWCDKTLYSPVGLFSDLMSILGKESKELQRFGLPLKERVA